MRIGLFADIHGNFIALEKVLSEFQQEQVDQLICLGDVVALGPQPHEVLERLRELRCVQSSWAIQTIGICNPCLREMRNCARSLGGAPTVDRR